MSVPELNRQNTFATQLHGRLLWQGSGEPQAIVSASACCRPQPKCISSSNETLSYEHQQLRLSANSKNQYSRGGRRPLLDFLQGRRVDYSKDLMELHIEAVSSILVAKYRNRDLTLWLVFELNGLILSGCHISAEGKQ